MGCAPSLTTEIEFKTRHLFRIGCNRAYEFNPDILVGHDETFWRVHHEALKEYKGDKWCDWPDVCEKYGLKHIKAGWEPGLSTDPAVVNIHHSTGPMAVGMAYHYGCDVILLVGIDVRFNGEYDPKARTSTKPRHYFGEDESTDWHWPINVDPKTGVLTVLKKEWETIRGEDYGIEIINCSMDSALEHFPKLTIDEALEKYDV